MISHWTRGGTWSTTPYNHYSLLASIEEIFGLPYLGYANAAGLNPFGLDVYNNGWRQATVRYPREWRLSRPPCAQGDVNLPSAASDGHRRR